MNDESDIDRALSMVGFLCHDSDDMRYIVVDGDPVSKARPRFSGHGRVYTPTKQKAASDALGWRLRELFPDPWEGNIAVGCVFFRSTQQRVDADNMLKQVLDAANGICFRDDYQVTALAAFLELDRERPRSLIVFGHHQSTMDRSGVLGQLFTCAHCAREFRSYMRATGRPPVYCSRECRGAAAKRTRVPHTVGAGICDMCGKRLSRPDYQRCRACWISTGLRPRILEPTTTEGGDAQ